MLHIANRLTSVKEYFFATKLREIEQLKQSGKTIISLAIGGPDLAPDTSVISSLYEEALKPNQHSYQSYQGNIELRKAIAFWYKQSYGVSLQAENQILPLMGSKEGILHLCFTYLNQGDKVLIPNPGYPTYKSADNLAGGVCVEYDLLEKNNWQIDFDALEKIDLNGIKIMFVNYPHMPTGTLPQEDTFKKLIAFGKKNNILICNDNPYSFIRNDNPTSLLSVPGAFETAIELNSLSKSHNMAGWRMGMLLGSEEHIANVLRFKSNMDSGMFLPLQLAAIKALSLPSSWNTALNKTYYEREQKAKELATLLNCSFVSEQAGLFLWAKVPEAYSSGYILCDKLLYECNIFITPGGIFGSNGEKYVRISLCSPISTFEKAILNINNSSLFL